MLPDHVRLACLLERLRELDQRRVTDHERPILEVARASVREAITQLSHRLHDTDYCHGAAERWQFAPATVAPRSQRNIAELRQLHDEADIPLADGLFR